MVRSQKVRRKTTRKVHILTATALVVSVAAGVTSAFALCEPTQTGGPIQWVVKTPIPIGRGAATGVIIGDDIYVTHGVIPTFGETAATSIYNIPFFLSRHSVMHPWPGGLDCREPSSARAWRAAGPRGEQP